MVVDELLRTIGRWVWIAVLAAVSASCGPPTVSLATQPPSPGGLAALVGPVRLELDPGHATVCVVAVGPTVRYALDWPNGWQAIHGAALGIVNRDGASVAAIGDTVWLGGGEVPPPWPDLRDCPDGGHVWWVADVAHQAPPPISGLH